MVKSKAAQLFTGEQGGERRTWHQRWYAFSPAWGPQLLVTDPDSVAVLSLLLDHNLGCRDYTHIQQPPVSSTEGQCFLARSALRLCGFGLWLKGFSTSAWHSSERMPHMAQRGTVPAGSKLQWMACSIAAKENDQTLFWLLNPIKFKPVMGK